MGWDYQHVWRTWNPLTFIPPEYNLGVSLTHGQLLRCRGQKPALHWVKARGHTRSFTYQQLDALTNRLASSLVRLRVGRGDRGFLRLPNLHEIYVAALAGAKRGDDFIR